MTVSTHDVAALTDVPSALHYLKEERAYREAWEREEWERQNAEREYEEQMWWAAMHDPTSDVYYSDGAVAARRDAGL